MLKKGKNDKRSEIYGWFEVNQSESDANHTFMPNGIISNLRNWRN